MVLEYNSGINSLNIANIWIWCTQEYAFDMVIVIPRLAHNSMCSKEAGGQQCGPEDQLSKGQFDDGVQRFIAANYSVVFYTSVMLGCVRHFCTLFAFLALIIDG